MDTSWNKVAKWYDDLVEGEGSYQQEVILPNLIRLLSLKGGEKVLDLACGQGFFAREFTKLGALVSACDLSKELIALAKERGGDINYFVHSAEKLLPSDMKNFDKVTLISAIQNISNFKAVFSNSSLVLKSGGELLIVMNHPAFRIPRGSSWGFDEANQIQYRRVDRYLSEASTKIDMTPGKKTDKEYTVSFHRPLGAYVAAAAEAGFVVVGLEEWISNRKSQPGPRSRVEDYARKEIPLFLTLIFKKNDC